jgi:hypothetical protein
MSSLARRFGGAGLRRGIRGSRSRVSAGPPWDPSQLTGLEAWYRETYAAGTWSDLSGKGRHLGQATESARPTQVTRAGQLALSFDGGDFLRGSFGSTVAQPTTIYVVWESGSVSATRYLFDGDTTSPRQRLYTSGDEHGFGTSSASNVDVDAATGVLYASCAVFNGASSALYFRDFTAAALTASVGSGGLAGFTVGANASDATLFIGYIWELIACSGAHDAPTRKLVGDYLSARYAGLTITT